MNKFKRLLKIYNCPVNFGIKKNNFYVEVFFPGGFKFWREDSLEEGINYYASMNNCTVEDFLLNRACENAYFSAKSHLAKLELLNMDRRKAKLLSRHLNR